MAKQVPDVVDPRLVKAFEHPIRVHILSFLAEGPSSPARISRRLPNVSLNLVSHHIKVLRELDCIELVETIEKRGAREHIYRAMEPHVFSDREWEELRPEVRQPLTAKFLRMISAEIGQSLMTGKLDELPDRHLSWQRLRLDTEGWAEAKAILWRALEEIMELNERSAERIEASDEPPLEARAGIMLFPAAEEG